MFEEALLAEKKEKNCPYIKWGLSVTATLSGITGVALPIFYTFQSEGVSWAVTGLSFALGSGGLYGVYRLQKPSSPQRFSQELYDSNISEEIVPAICKLEEKCDGFLKLYQKLGVLMAPTEEKKRLLKEILDQGDYFHGECNWTPILEELETMQSQSSWEGGDENVVIERVETLKAQLTEYRLFLESQKISRVSSQTFGQV